MTIEYTFRNLFFFSNREYLNADIILENQFPLGKISTLFWFSHLHIIAFTFSSTKGVSSAATTSHRAQG